MRVLQGVTGQAGQPHTIALGLRRLGIDAQSISIQEHKFGYPADIHHHVPRDAGMPTVMAGLMPILDQFDVVHFHARSFFSFWPHQAHPSLLDLLALKMRGKKVFFHFRGGEIRMEDSFRRSNPFHYADDQDGSRLFTKMPDEAKRRSLAFINAVCDGVLANDPEIQTYAPGATIVPRVLLEEDWPYVGVSHRKRPVVVHAPSRRGVKGTEHILAAMEQLRNDGYDFDLRLVEGLPHAEAAAIYRDADIIIDQLRIGWHGVLTTEAMALGKPCVAYIRSDLWEQHPLPIVNANPDNLVERLRPLLTSFVARASLGWRARLYFLAHHSDDVVCRNLARLYEAPAREVDMLGVAEFLAYQAAVSEAAGATRARIEDKITAKQTSEKIKRVLAAANAQLKAAEVQRRQEKAQRRAYKRRLVKAAAVLAAERDRVAALSAAIDIMKPELLPFARLYRRVERWLRAPTPAVRP